MASVETQHNCRLMTLPRAIRDRIYDLTFPPQRTAAPINLADAEPPSMSLLLTCRQTYSEAKAKHHAVTRSYWQDNIFYVFVTQHEDVRQTKASKSQAAAAVTTLNNAIVEHLRLEIRWQVISTFHIGGKDWYDRELHAWRHDPDPEAEVKDPKERTCASILIPNEAQRLQALEDAGFRANCRSNESLLRYVFYGKDWGRIEEVRELGGCAGSMKEEVLWWIDLFDREACNELE